MSLAGNIKDFGLPDIYQLIFMQKRTGILSLFREKEVVTISFEKGLVVFADEFQRSEQERLGAVLLKSKLITPQQLLKAVEIQKQTYQKLGYILVNHGFLSEDQLKRALQMQVRETVFKTLRWEDGQYKFTLEPVIYDTNFYTGMSTDHLVMEGIRRIDEWPMIKKKISGMDLIFDRVEQAEEKIAQTASSRSLDKDLDSILAFEDDVSLAPPPGEEGEESRGLKLAPSERIIFALVDGTRTVEDLVDEGRIGEFETHKALFSLLSMGLIRKVGTRSAPQEKSASDAGGLSLRKVAVPLLIILAVAVSQVVNPLGLVRSVKKTARASQSMGLIHDELKREKIRFALTCYYLEKKQYPSVLSELVSARLLRPGDTVDHRGGEFAYLREQSGYSLRSTSIPAGKGRR
jgi:hypothetical protein